MKETHGRSLCSKGKSEDSTLLLGLLKFYNLGHGGSQVWYPELSFCTVERIFPHLGDH